MENWGLVTYVENMLSYNPDTQSDEDKARLARDVCHETGSYLYHKCQNTQVTLF